MVVANDNRQSPIANQKSYRLGLTGYPLGHSLSPRLHAAALRAAGLAGDYRLFPVPPDDAAGLAALLARLRGGELHGLNVTIPHKRAVLPLLDGLTPAAQAIGAANTLWLAADGALWGDNTDAPGFWQDARRLLGDGARRQSALVLGAGGSARAVVYALAQAGWQVTVAARRQAQAAALVDALAPAAAGSLRAVPLTAAALAGQRPALLVNTTPVGMAPRADAPQAALSPWPEELALPAETAVYDLVYNPAETALVRAARAAGLRAQTGLGMLISQASLAFARWTGVTVPEEVWRAAAAPPN